jgi:hypothetical protein
LPGVGGLSPVVGDLNGDGKIDIAIANAVLLGRGDGTFAVNPSLLTQFATTAADFNGDGMLDLASPNGTGIYIQLENPGDFTGYPSPWTRTVTAGANAGYTLFIEPLHGYLGTVTIAATGLPAGVTASFQPGNTIQNSNGFVSLTLVTDPSTAPGSYPVRLTATSGSLTHGVTITLVVTAETGDFTGSIVPGAQTLGQGEIGSVTVQVIPINGFTGSVTLSVTGVPAGATASFNPQVVTGGSGSTVLTIATGFAPVGKYNLTLTGTSGAISHSATVIFNVSSNADFTGRISPSSAAVVPGGRASYTASVIPLNGFTGNVVVSVSGLPTGAAAQVTPGTVRGGSGSASILITTTSSTPLGSYTLTLTGTCGTLVHSTSSIQLNVNATPGDFGATINPTTNTITAGGFASYGINVYPVNGFTGNVALSVSGVPSGATAAFNPNNIVSGGTGSVTLVITTTSGVTPGTYALSVTGISGSISHTAGITLIINPGP